MDLTSNRGGIPRYLMVQTIKNETIDTRIVRVEANPAEVEQVYHFDAEGNLIGSVWRIKAVPV